LDSSDPDPKCPDTSAPILSRITGAEVSRAGPKCVVAEVSGNHLNKKAVLCSAKRAMRLYMTKVTINDKYGVAYALSIGTKVDDLG